MKRSAPTSTRVDGGTTRWLSSRSSGRAGDRSTSRVSGRRRQRSASSAGCPDKDDEEGLIIRRGDHAFAVLNRYPYASGHLMVGPYRHVAGPGDLDDDERSEMWSLLALGEEACRRAFSPDGFNIGANLGRVAGRRGARATSTSTSSPDGPATPIS